MRIDKTVTGMKAQAILSKNGKKESLLINGKVEIKSFDANKWNYVVFAEYDKNYYGKPVPAIIPRVTGYQSKHRGYDQAVSSIERTITDNNSYNRQRIANGTYPISTNAIYTIVKIER